MTAEIKSRKREFINNLSTARYNAGRATETKTEATKSEPKKGKLEFINKLSTARYNARRATETKTEATKSEPQKEWFKDYGIVTTRYLQEVYLINTPNDFPKQLNLANSRNESVVRSLKLSFNTLDGIVKSCEKWKDYLADQQSFELLVCLEVMSMTKIHASVIAARNFHEKQGPMGVRLKDEAYIPYRFTTIVSRFGEVMVYS